MIQAACMTALSLAEPSLNSFGFSTGTLMTPSPHPLLPLAMYQCRLRARTIRLREWYEVDKAQNQGDHASHPEWGRRDDKKKRRGEQLQGRAGQIDACQRFSACSRGGGDVSAQASKAAIKEETDAPDDPNRPVACSQVSEFVQ